MYDKCAAGTACWELRGCMRSITFARGHSSYWTSLDLETRGLVQLITTIFVVPICTSIAYVGNFIRRSIYQSLHAADKQQSSNLVQLTVERSIVANYTRCAPFARFYPPRMVSIDQQGTVVSFLDQHINVHVRSFNLFISYIIHHRLHI